MTNLTLVCYIEGDRLRDRFVVEIDSNKRISQLRDEIFAKGLLDAPRSDIWKLKKPISTRHRFSEELPIVLGNLTMYASLLEPDDRLCEVFTAEPPMKHLHIIVQKWTAGLRLGAGHFLGIPHEDDLVARRLRRIELLPHKPPSTLGQPEEFKACQESSTGPVFFFDRLPSAAVTIPVTLLHPVFGQFIDDCDSYSPTKEDNAFAFEVSAAMREMYETEDDRSAALLNIFLAYGIAMAPSVIPGTSQRTEGDIHSNLFRYAILEAKLEIGSNGAEPLFQAAWDYQGFTKEESPKHSGSPLPCLLLYLVGAHLGFAGAVYTDRPNVQVLSTPLPLFYHYTDTKLRAMTARHLGAMRRTLRSLQEYYDRDLKGIRAMTVLPNPCYPYRSSFTSLLDSTVCDFRYVSSLPRKLVFFGQTSEGEDICIKFVRSYSKDVHERCASLGFAPALKGFEPLPGGWLMVIMAVIGDDYCHFHELQQPVSYRAEIEQKLATLHQAEYVHGDIRDTNLLVKRDSTSGFVLLDFDWAGKIGEARYPMNVNTGPGLKRPAGAFDGELITADHDMEMLRIMFEGSASGSIEK